MNAKTKRRRVAARHAEMRGQMSKMPSKESVRRYVRAYKRWTKRRSGPKPEAPLYWLEAALFGNG